MNSSKRNTSIDTAISATLSKTGPNSSSKDVQPTSTDIASLIKAAGSPEAVIQHLLKEKQSQSQQNNQLWRLVDKQRAMVWGLNKDLESALKDKDKYRRKLKELMANPAIATAVGGQVHDKNTAQLKNTERTDLGTTGDITAIDPHSPVLGSDSQKDSPVDVSMAPYPITPPADHPRKSPSPVADLLDPVRTMPKPEEHAANQYDHEAEERADENARNEQNNESVRELPYNVSLPPSRSLPSEPPRMPPPDLPVIEPPSSADVAARRSSRSPSTLLPAPRKGPPAPLQLGTAGSKQSIISTATLDDDSDSDYDDILEVDGIPHANRGRRRTREEDDRKRELQMAAETDIGEESESQPGSSLDRGMVPASLNSILQTDPSRDLAPPMMSPGLPASPRPLAGGAKSPSQPGALAPLSPRPPRQPIVMPPDTPIVTSATAPASLDATTSRLTPEPLNAAKRSVSSHEHQDSVESSTNTASERTKIFKGLMVDEFPDLLLPPNALPSIDIKVASSRMKPSRASILSLTQLEEDPVFTLAILSRADCGELWRVEKDTASLSKLDQRMKHCSAFTAKTPDRSLFNGHAPAKLDARRMALDHYMDELLNTPLDIATAVELCKYLSTNTLPPNADETGAAAPTAQLDSSPEIDPDYKPTRSGYLTKRGKNFGGWKMRFFVLDGPQLKYYETPGGTHLGTIKLQHAQIGRQSQRDNQSPSRPNTEEPDSQYRHAFLIREPKKKDSSTLVKHVLCAESDKERDLWVNALLHWIDDRDIDTSDTPAKAQDRRGSETSDPLTKSRKSSAARGGQPTGDSDALFGVRYDSTNAGDAPLLTTTRPKTSGGGPDNQSIGSGSETPQPKTISAPKDMQLISDASAWGNKGGLSVPNHEEKKQRKRSFFGFGPKARSSADGPEGVLGSGDHSSMAAPQSLHHIATGQVFGAPLMEAIRYNEAHGLNVPVPSVAYRCIQYLEAKNAVQEEGIFRLSGSNVVIKQLRERFNNEGDIDLVTDEQYYDIHAVASLLKLYLRELPTTILTRELHMEFVSTTELPDQDEKIRTMNGVARRLPPANSVLLQYLVSFLIKIINNSDVNKMTVRNVGIVFSPTLNIPAPIFATFLQNYEGIFGIAPEDYRLPATIFGVDGQPAPGGPSRFEAPGRPSTSSGGSVPSPHLQPRTEALRDLARSTPTPPLSMANPSRSTPTPPGTNLRPAYEPAHLPKQAVQQQQQQATPHSLNVRPAYESGYDMPPGIQVQDVHPAPRATPGYERQTYEPAPDAISSNNLAAHGGQAQDGTGNSKRRESAVYGALGVHNQSAYDQPREDYRV